MNVSTYREWTISQIIDFIALCYISIGRIIDIKDKDSDLMDIEHEYCDSGGNFFVLQDNGDIMGTIAIKFFYCNCSDALRKGIVKT